MMMNVGRPRLETLQRGQRGRIRRRRWGRRWRWRIFDMRRRRLRNRRSDCGGQMRRRRRKGTQLHGEKVFSGRLAFLLTLFGRLTSANASVKYITRRRKVFFRWYKKSIHRKNAREKNRGRKREKLRYFQIGSFSPNLPSLDAKARETGDTIREIHAEGRGYRHTLCRVNYYTGWKVNTSIFKNQVSIQYP